jgi:ABC-2 type transport system permease protein
MPILLVAINLYSIIGDGSRDTGHDAEGADEAAAAPGDLPAIGLVDAAGLIQEMPPGFPEDLFERFADETAARTALEAGEIEQYVYLPVDYVTSGEVTVYDQDFRILQSGSGMGAAFNSESEWVLPYVINYNLLADEEVLRALRNPVPGAFAKFHALQPVEAIPAENRQLAEVVSSVMPYVYYFLLVMGGSYLMRSVVGEKENRTAEVLLLSVNPRELMIGKMLAMSVVMAIQAVVWVGGGILALNRGADVLNVAAFDFPPGFVLWALLFLIVGYLLYAAIMAAAGALAQNAREGGQVIWLLILPLMPTLMFGSEFVKEPHGTLALVLSLFPLSAPSAMVTRLAVAQIPLWQVLVSLAGLAVTAYLCVMLASRFFRSGNLLSQESFNWRRLATGWRRAG